MPKRIQRRRTKGWRMPPGAVYVGRGTVYGNPCGDGNAGHDVGWYVWWLLNTSKGREVLARARRDLAGKHLACWCPLSRPCHADVLLLAVNGPEEGSHA